MDLPESCQALPTDSVRNLLSHLGRIQSIEWLNGRGSKAACAIAMRDYFVRLERVPKAKKSYFLASSDPPRGLFRAGHDKSYQDVGTFGIKWIEGDWKEAVGWRSHCHLRGNITALSDAIDYMTSLAQKSGRDAARHDCWDTFGEIAKQSAPDEVKDGAWFSAGADAAWTTISDLADSENPFEPMLQIWEQGFWPIGHVHSYQNEFVVFVPDVAPVKVFISYKWQDEKRNAWVEGLYRDLRARGIDAKLDRYEVPLGGSFTQYMGSKINECKRVLFVITPASTEAANRGEGGVGFETQLANSIRMSGERGAFIVPILREGNFPPHFLRDHRWIDFRDPRKYPRRLDELVEWLTDSIHPPRLGLI